MFWSTNLRSIDAQVAHRSAQRVGGPFSISRNYALYPNGGFLQHDGVLPPRVT